MGCSCAQAAGAASCCAPAPCVALAFAIELSVRQPSNTFSSCEDFHDDSEDMDLFGDSDYLDKSGADASGYVDKCNIASQIELGGGERDYEEVEWGGAEAEVETEAALYRLSRCSSLVLSCL